jgi:FkbM family methyltransferase
MDSLKAGIKKYLLKRWDLHIPLSFGRVFFSQEGEDALIWRIIGASTDISRTYVDVGCNHPYRMSNTAFFYRKGWSGVAIDPNPDFGRVFTELRPRDSFVNCGVSTTNGELTYFEFEESLYNTFNKEKADEVGLKHSRLIGSRLVPVRRLEDILGGLWPNGKNVTFLTVDCEGMDLLVLQSMNFEKYVVDFVCIEILSATLSELNDHPISTFLIGQGYECISKLSNSCIFVLKARMSIYGL